MRNQSSAGKRIFSLHSHAQHGRDSEESEIRNGAGAFEWNIDFAVSLTTLAQWLAAGLNGK